MFKIRVLSPFRHNFRQKEIWLTNNEAYHLDPDKDRDEIKYFLSSSFPYAQYVYFNRESLDKALLDEVSQEGGFSQVGEAPEAEKSSDYLLPNHDNFDSPIRDMEPNYFAHQIEAPKLFKPEPEPEAVAPADSLPQLSTSSKFPEAEPFTPTVPVPEKEKVTRIAELTKLNWRKLKDVAEGYGIDYTDKETVVKAIIDLEYK